MDQARFLEACRWACSGEAVRQGIGTLGEKTLHSAVKYYFQPDPSQREVRLGRYVADALTSQGATEVPSPNREGISSLCMRQTNARYRNHVPGRCVSKRTGAATRGFWPILRHASV